MQKKGPWTIKDSRSIYKNEWIEIVEDRVVRPDGKDGIFTVVHQKPGITVIPVDEENNVYLVKEYHYAVERETIEAVSGGIEEGEDAIGTASRELEEEAGIIAKELTPLGMVHPFTSAVLSPSSLFMAKGLTFTKQTLEGTENIKVLKMPLSQAIDLIEKGEIVHASTIILLYKIQSLIGR